MKMIVCDVDGTLLNDEEVIMPKTKQLLIDLQQQGIRLVLASGRGVEQIYPFAKELQMEQYGGYIIEVNGMAIVDMKTHEREVLKRLSEKEVQEIFTFLTDLNVEFMGMLDQGVLSYIPKERLPAKLAYIEEHQLPKGILMSGSEELVYDYGIPAQKITYIDQEFEADQEVNKVIILEQGHAMEEVMRLAKQDLIDFEICLSFPGMLEISPAGVSKGNTLMLLCERLQIDHSDVVVFGDGENDISMFRFAKHAFLMENGFAHLLPFVSEKTKGNNEEGIYHGLMKMIHGANNLHMV